jgi:hypothetical protein
MDAVKESPTLHERRGRGDGVVVAAGRAGAG